MVPAGLKLKPQVVTALRQLARVRSLKGGRQVTVGSMLRPVVDSFLRQHKQEVDEALALLEQEGAR